MPLQEAFGNIWYMKGTPVITTNGFVRSNGTLVMGRGIAAQATKMVDGLDRTLGDLVTDKGNHVYFIPHPTRPLLSFPVKHVWWEDADPDLIWQSCVELIFAVDIRKEIKLPILVARPGCGNGGLNWEKDVKEICEHHFGEDPRFIIVDREQSG